jgi:hypothetical protein
MPSLTNIESNFLAFDSISNLPRARSVRIESNETVSFDVRFRQIECGVSHLTYVSNMTHLIRYRIEWPHIFDRKSTDSVERVTRIARALAKVVLASFRARRPAPRAI